MKQIKILIVDDHAILRMGLASLLETQKDLEIVGDASSGPIALKKYPRLRPDVVIMDLAMPGMDGVETTKQLLRLDSTAKVLILTTFGTSDGITQALSAGAKGAVMKNVDFAELVTAIHKINDGKNYLTAEIQRILEDDPPVPQLSPRQRQILNALVRGFTNPDIAKQLGISLNMVKEHINALYAKLGAGSRAEAIAIALRKQLLKMQPEP